MGRNFRSRVAKATVRWKKLGIMTSKCNMLWEMLAEWIIKCFSKLYTGKWWSWETFTSILVLYSTQIVLKASFVLEVGLQLHKKNLTLTHYTRCTKSSHKLAPHMHCCVCVCVYVCVHSAGICKEFSLSHGVRLSLYCLFHALSITFVKYVGCFQDADYQDPAHLYNYSTKICVHFNCLTL